MESFWLFLNFQTRSSQPTFQNVVLTYYALQAFGITVPFTELLVKVPIIFGTTFLPISPAGMGTPQLLWSTMFTDYGDPETFLAFSLLWTTSFALVRFTVGALFFKRFWGWLTTPGTRGPGGVLIPEAPLTESQAS